MHLFFEDTFLERLSGIFSAAHYPCAIADSALRILWCSDAMRQFDPSLALPDGLIALLGDLSPDFVHQAVEAQGTFSLAQPGFVQERAVCICALTESGSPARYLVLPAAAPDQGSGLRPAGASRAASAFDAQYRKPLNTIFATLSALYRQNSDNPDLEARARTNEYLATINQNTYLLRRCCDLLGMFTRITQGLWPPVLHRAELCGYLRELLEAVKQTAEMVGVRLVTELPSSPVVLTCDYGKLEATLGCVLSNALRCTPMGGEVHFRVRAANGSVRLRISDSGPGISPDVLPHVCEPFFSANADGEPFSGNGLGLSIAKGCIAALGGTLTITSEPGKGTIVLFSLPLVEDDTGIILQSPAPIYPADRQSIIRVLLADAAAPPLP